MSSAITAIIIDDEKSARNILSNLLLRFCPQVEVLAAYANIPESLEGIKTLKPDVVFLDIEMPQYAGFEIVNFFESLDFEIVFVTAYDQYAIKAFEVAALDYLLKPVNISRLKQAVARLEERLQSRQNPSESYQLLSSTLQGNQVKTIAVFEKGYRIILNLEEVIAFEAQESYSKVYLSDGTMRMASKNLKHFEELLEDNPAFFRTHKSWIINRDFQESYSRSRLDINLQHDVVAKLSKYRKADFEAWLSQPS